MTGHCLAKYQYTVHSTHLIWAISVQTLISSPEKRILASSGSRLESFSFLATSRDSVYRPPLFSSTVEIVECVFVCFASYTVIFMVLKQFFLLLHRVEVFKQNCIRINRNAKTSWVDQRYYITWLNPSNVLAPSTYLSFLLYEKETKYKIIRSCAIHKN